MAVDETSVLVSASVDSPAPAGARSRVSLDEGSEAHLLSRSRTPSPALGLGPSRLSLDDDLAQATPSGPQSPPSPLESRSGGDSAALPGAAESSPPDGRPESSPAASSSSWYGTTATLVTPKTWLGWAKGAAAYASVAVSPAKSGTGAADLTPQTGQATPEQHVDGGAGNMQDGDGGRNAVSQREPPSSSALALTPPFVRPHSAVSDAPSDAPSSVATDDAAEQTVADDGGALVQSSARGISAHQALQLGVQGKLTGAAVSDMALHASWALWAGGEDSAPGIAPVTAAAEANGRSPRRPVDPDAAALLAAAAGQRRRKAKPRAVEL